VLREWRAVVCTSYTPPLSGQTHKLGGCLQPSYNKVLHLGRLHSATCVTWRPCDDARDRRKRSDRRTINGAAPLPGIPRPEAWRAKFDLFVTPRPLPLILFNILASSSAAWPVLASLRTQRSFNSKCGRDMRVWHVLDGATTACRNADVLSQSGQLLLLALLSSVNGAAAASSSGHCCSQRAGPSSKPRCQPLPALALQSASRQCCVQGGLACWCQLAPVHQQQQHCPTGASHLRSTMLQGRMV
jgi:hypothetical protein